MSASYGDPRYVGTISGPTIGTIGGRPLPQSAVMSPSYSTTPMTTTPILSAPAEPIRYSIPSATPFTYGGTIPVTTTAPAVIYNNYDVALPTKMVETPSLTRRCFCEFLGTFLILLTMINYGVLYTVAFYVAIIYTFWYVSGAHLNPAISLAVFLAGKMPMLAFLCYVVSQVAGAALAGLVVKWFFAPVYSGASLLAVSVSGTVSVPAVVTIQVIYTTMLIFVALNVMCIQRYDKSQYYGIAIGFAVLAGGYVDATMTTVLFNPALTIGVWISVNSVPNLLTGLWIILAQLGGAILGLLLFKICRFQDPRADQDIFFDLDQFSTSRVGASSYMTEQSQISLNIRVLCEFLGTFWFVFTIIINTAMGTGGVAWAGAGALVSLIYALSDISGGHFNPAITTAVMVAGHTSLSSKAGIEYLLAQLVAAIPAGLIAKMISMPTSDFVSTTSYNWLSFGFAEFLFTMILVYVALVVMTSDMNTVSRANFYYALAIGFVFVGASNAIGNISGGYLNPATPFGFLIDAMDLTAAASVKSWPAWADWVIRSLALVCKVIAYLCKAFYYWFPEICGAILGAYVFLWTKPKAIQEKMLY